MARFLHRVVVDATFVLGSCFHGGCTSTGSATDSTRAVEHDDLASRARAAEQKDVASSERNRPHAETSIPPFPEVGCPPRFDGKPPNAGRKPDEIGVFQNEFEVSRFRACPEADGVPGLPVAFLDVSAAAGHESIRRAASDEIRIWANLGDQLEYDYIRLSGSGQRKLEHILWNSNLAPPTSLEESPRDRLLTTPGCGHLRSTILFNLCWIESNRFARILAKKIDAAVPRRMVGVTDGFRGFDRDAPCMVIEILTANMHRVVYLARAATTVEAEMEVFDRLSRLVLESRGQTEDFGHAIGRGRGHAGRAGHETRR
jgi:hypothetical protein